MYGIFHTVSFIESNVTHNLSPRKMRFYSSEDADDNSSGTSEQLQNLYKLYQMYGPTTKVSVDYYSSHMKGGHDLLRDFIQREGNSFRWKMNGMGVEDVAIVSDTDETFTRFVVFEVWSVVCLFVFQYKSKYSDPWQLIVSLLSILIETFWEPCR